jgi:hypothetical protein
MITRAERAERAKASRESSERWRQDCADFWLTTHERYFDMENPLTPEEEERIRQEALAGYDRALAAELASARKAGHPV